MFLTFLCTFWIFAALADDALIVDIAKREKTTPAEVKETLEKGCDSGITPEMSRCGYYHWVGADIQLNRSYNELLKKLGTKAAKEKLVKAQRAWLAFRDATCKFESDEMAGGTGEGVLYLGCLGTVTEERNLKLKEYLECGELAGCPGFH